MCSFLTNGNVLSPFSSSKYTYTFDTVHVAIADILPTFSFILSYFHHHHHNHRSCLLPSLVLLSFSYFQLRINFCCCFCFCYGGDGGGGFFVICSSISLIVFASFYHHLCQRNKIYDLSLQSNTTAELHGTSLAGSIAVTEGNASYLRGYFDMTTIESSNCSVKPYQNSP